MEERKNIVQSDKCLLRAQEKAADPGSASSKTELCPASSLQAHFRVTVGS